MRNTFGKAAMGALIWLIATGCTPDFDPFWKINSLRVMGIQADPVVAKPFEPVTLSALTYAPGDADIDYDWSWCPVRTSAADDFRCPVDEEDLAELMEADSDPGGDFDGFFDLGDDSTATFVSPFEAEEVREFCEEIQRLFLEEFDDPAMAQFLPGGDCSEGYEITVRLEVTTDEERVVASKRFLLWGGADEYNENPVVEDFQIRPYDPGDLSALREEAGWEVDENADHDEQWLSLADDAPVHVVADIRLELRTLVDPDSVLEYTPPTPVGSDEEPEPRTESYVYRYLTTAGTLDRSRRIFAEAENTLEDASNTQFTITSEDIDDDCGDDDIEGGFCRVQLWSVVRDSRLGMDWVSGSLRVETGE